MKRIHISRQAMMTFAFAGLLFVITASAAIDREVRASGELHSGTETRQAGTDKSERTAEFNLDPVEDAKKQKSAVLKMNALITQSNEAIAAKEWQKALASLQDLIMMDPKHWQFYQGLGTAQINLGQYDDAIRSFEKAIEASDANTKVDRKDPSTDPIKKKSAVAQMLTYEGNAYLKLKKDAEAITAYKKAASIAPNPAIAYFNLCATLYNTGDTDGAAAACDKAIQADPMRADAYFIKGSALYGNGKLDAGGKYRVPVGTVESLKKYLELAPDGPHAEDVKAMLEALGLKGESLPATKKLE